MRPHTHIIRHGHGICRASQRYSPRRSLCGLGVQFFGGTEVPKGVYI